MKLSIITINYNNKEGLIKTIASVGNQNSQSFEYIIIDGGSTDGSVEIIKQNSDKINYWVSENDSGIYNAMNKGIKIAKGEYLLFLNSGDYLVSNTTIECFISETNGYDLVYGRRYTEYSDGRLVCFDSYTKLSLELFFTGYSIPHQATLIKNELFIKYGLYDEGLKLVSDWKFFILVLFKHKCTYLFKDIHIVNFDAHGLSNSIENYELWNKEMDFVIDTEFNSLAYLKKVSHSIFSLINYKNKSKSFKFFSMLGFFKVITEKLEILETVFYDS